MRYDKFKGLFNASVMIATMFFISSFYYMRPVPTSSASAVSAGSQNSTVTASSRSSSVSASPERTLPVENPHLEKPVSSEAVKKNTKSAPVSSQPKNAQKVKQYYDVPLSFDLQDYLFSECLSKKVSVDLVLALIDVESAFNPNRISKTNDYGLMQINICHKDFLRNTLQVTDLLDEKQNIKAGVYMLSGIVNKYGDVNQALMVYNRGEAGAKKLWNSGVYSTVYSRNVIAKIDEIKKLV